MIAYPIRARNATMKVANPIKKDEAMRLFMPAILYSQKTKCPTTEFSLSGIEARDFFIGAGGAAVVFASVE
jgi:hypothetical protein